MKIFNPGSELANLTVVSGVLQLSWKEINGGEQYSSSSSLSLSYRISEDPKRSNTVITFSTSRNFATRKLLEGPDLVSSSSSIATESFALFEFLRGKTDFAINRAAITLFNDNLFKLKELKNKIRDIIMNKNNSSPVIVTGHSLGGSIASLFTLWLLESVTFSNKKRPLCITFGSPLLGDISLQKALSKYTPWSSCFLHVASNQDTVPRMFAANKYYRPFGTFLFCSESGCSCFEEPETVLDLLSKTTPTHQEPNPIVDYGKVVEDLKRKAFFKNMADTKWCENPYRVGIVTQLSAIGVVVPSEPSEDLAKKIETLEMKFEIGRRTVNQDRRLNNAKIDLVKVEWYKKSSKDNGYYYYDSFKKKSFTRDINIEECVLRLMNHWTDVVEGADMKPQTEVETLRTRWLYSGLNYMRLVEPLYIAEYYHEKGLSDYKNQGRPKHFARLEALVAESKKKEIQENNQPKFNTSVESRKKKIGSLLTEDSCFMARVEEASILCKLMKSEGTSDEEKIDCASKLSKFEDDVSTLLKSYAVSAEIFLPESSFIKWWNDYKELGKTMKKDWKTTSPLYDTMESGKYKKYIEGKL